MTDGAWRDPRIDRLAAALERHVAAHPNASDTIEGIQRWWLGPEFQEDASIVELAVEHLIDRGVMTRRELPDGKMVFSAPGPDTRPGRERGPGGRQENR